jgi:hypothetical protein
LIDLKFFSYLVDDLQPKKLISFQIAFIERESNFEINKGLGMVQYAGTVRFGKKEIRKNHNLFIFEFFFYDYRFE